MSAEGSQQVSIFTTMPFEPPSMLGPNIECKSQLLSLCHVMIVIFVAYCSFCRGGTFCQGNFLLEKLFDYHRDILHWRTCCQWFDFPFKRLQERFLVMAEKKSVLSNITGNFFIFCFRPPCLKMRILRIWFWLWRKMGGFEGGLIRAGEVSEAVPSLATAARSARESVTLQSAECSVASSSPF